MIPFASQRGYGQDLATHLLNTHDNETLEFGGIRGAIADDLHGAFSEWEAQAGALTKCRNYLYSLSINPDPGQGALSREQYLDYITRVEQRLGLTEQPRAVVFHKKYGREHCHVVWSRVDAENGKAVHIGFDRRSLMRVTKEFARDHGLELPEGYEKDGSKSHQLSLYEKAQQDGCGITMEQRIRDVTEAWKQSDSPRAFVNALAARGYVLATGKRPYVLVDVYGNMNALPKLIDDRSVRTKDIRKFLAQEFPPEKLPSVEEVREAAAKHREERGADMPGPDADKRRKVLEIKQQKRRDFLLAKKGLLAGQQGKEKRALTSRQKRERQVLNDLYRAESRSIRAERESNKLTGLAAFLGRVTGVQLVTKKVHAYQDRRRQKRFLELREDLASDHQHEQALQRKRHQLQALDFRRHERSLGALDQREKRSLELALLREARLSAREEREGESRDSVGVEFSKVAQQSLGNVFDQVVATPSEAALGIELSKEFSKAAKVEKDEIDEGKQGSSKGLKERSSAQEKEPRKRRRRRRRDRDLDKGR